MIEEDPFDTSAIIIPTAGMKNDNSNYVATSSANQTPVKTMNYEEKNVTKLPQMLSQLEPFISPKEKTPENNDDFRFV